MADKKAEREGRMGVLIAVQFTVVFVVGVTVGVALVCRGYWLVATGVAIFAFSLWTTLRGGLPH